ncbi:MAG: acyl-CoA synthetase [Pseudomonadota bacterium]
MSAVSNLGTINEAIAATIPDRDAIVFKDRRLSYGQLAERTRRLANFLLDQGFGCHKERDALSPWESGQDHVGLYLYNGNEYLEGMLGAFKSRTVPFNVNYRYVDEELAYLLNNARCQILIYHASLADRVASVRDQIPSLQILLQVNDDDSVALLPGAIDYEAALEQASNVMPDLQFTDDDLYILYTGGTTGMPKGVLWRQADILAAALGGKTSKNEIIPAAQFAERAERVNHRYLTAPPFMHGAGSWVAFQALHSGGTVLVQDNVYRLDADDIIDTCIRERADVMMIVGDAFGRPIADALEANPREMPALKNIITGGAVTTASLKSQLLSLLPHINIVDAAGSSETGSQGQHVSNSDSGAATGRFSLRPGNVVLNETMDQVLEAGHKELGWWAQSGQIPLGYLDDEKKTAATFVSVDGTRYSVPGDRVRLLTDGSLELHGRDSVTINSGGEKIFAEEVEQALKHHGDVYDAVVTSRASERWGQEVVAIVQLREGATQDEASLLAECEHHIARYKFPKSFVFCDEILRSPNGKADYRWAKAQVED